MNEERKNRNKVERGEREKREWGRLVSGQSQRSSSDVSMTCAKEWGERRVRKRGWGGGDKKDR